MDAHEAVREILKDIKSYRTSLNYAVGYAQEELRLPLGSQDSKVQCLYILNNIQHWRHPKAKEVRVALKAEAKG
jgi:hypothetical protein